jgi:glycosyltransferase involved in cell wall biosynthesis
MKISIALASYNGEKFLTDQLFSIINQSLLPNEIVIVDDCSQDGTVDIVKRFMNKKNQSDVKIKLFANKQNEGVLKTFQKAILKTEGDIIFFSDQDDLWNFKKIESTAKVFQSKRGVGVVATSYNLINQEGKMIKKGNDSGSLEEISFDSIIGGNKYPGCTMAIKSNYRHFFVDLPLGGFLHDWFIALISSIQNEFFYFYQPLTSYRLHEGNTIGINRRFKPRSNINKKLEWLRDREKFYIELADYLKANNIKIEKEALNIINAYGKFMGERHDQILSGNMVSFLRESLKKSRANCP